MLRTHHSFFLNNMITLGGIALMILTKSCAPGSTPINKLISINRLEVVTINEYEYYIKQINKEEVLECISSDNVLKTRIKNYDKDDFGGQGTLDFKDELVLRKLVKRGDIYRGMPKEYFRSSQDIKIFLCVDRKGKVKLSKLIESRQELNQQELGRLLSVAHDYEYEENVNASCLECGKLTIIFDMPIK